MENIDLLAGQIQKLHLQFQSYALKKVNQSLTLRNWLIGNFIVEFEQEGNNRAAYGQQTLAMLADRMNQKGLKSFSERSLRLYRQFYTVYPEIWQLPIAKLQTAEYEEIRNWQLPIANLDTFFKKPRELTVDSGSQFDLLVDRLSFTHFIELLRLDSQVKRSFYELQAIKNSWSVSQLKRNIDSLLYERIGLSTNKEDMLAKLKEEKLQKFTDIVKSPYILEFLGIEEKAEYSETELEEAIINHLQKFLIEMGRGFCFEARQKRITFNNKHYRIDLVFYHRILKCHVLIDLKMGEFDHADAGQMNLYLNYFNENETSDGDNYPVGIVLCSQKDNALVHYATGGLPQEVFVARYLLQLPSEEALKRIINEEMEQYEV
jgi:predicted nuclease of restriction endonuclease-like (RecB) superfamily